MDATNLDIREISEGYRRRRFLPSEVVESFLNTIEARNPEINAFLEVRREETLAIAKEMDENIAESSRKPLFGVPVALKDNFHVQGWKTTAGSKILEGYVAPYTATSVNRLLQAGALVVGKTNMDEFAMGSSNENSAFGVVKNPWDTSRVPGGSSGGSAAAVSSLMAPIALGTDTGGSIRQPAGFCGVVGLKPSYGRVSRYGVIAFASSLDQVGPITRSVWDAAKILEVMAGYHGKDATASRRIVPEYTSLLKNASLKNAKIGVIPQLLENTDEDVRTNFEETLKSLQSEGAQIVEVYLPHVRYSVSVYYLIATAEASSNLARYDGVRYGLRSPGETIEQLYEATRGHGFGDEVKLRIMLGTHALSSGYYDAFYKKASLVRAKIVSDFNAAFDLVDVIAMPTSPSTAFSIGERIEDPLKMYLSDIFTIPANLAGLPAISLPSGLDSKGLPLGVQFLGRAFDEAGVLQVASEFERSHGGVQSPFSGGTL